MKNRHHNSGQVFRISGVLQFEEEINISSICDSGYDAGKACLIQLKRISEQKHVDNVHCIYGHFVYCKPVPCLYNQKKCSEIDTQTEQFCLKDLFRETEHCVACTPKRKLFRNVDEVIDFFKRFWDSPNGKIMGNVLLKGHEYREVRAVSNVPEFKNPSGASLTINQKRASIVMAFSYPVTIIEAPAGTGKAQTIASAALSKLMDFQLIVCNTNSAAEAVIARLRKWYHEDGKIIRLKSTVAFVRFPDIYNCGEGYWYNKIMAEKMNDVGVIEAFLIKSYIDARNEFRDPANKITDCNTDWQFFDKLEHAARKLVSKRKAITSLIHDTFTCSIYVCTIDYAVLHLKKKFPRLVFNKIFFDEGSQVRLCDVLLILAMYPYSAFSILGDTKQLPPFIEYNVALTKEEKILSKNAMIGLKNDIYATTITLNVNFKSHPEIVALGSKIFYNRRLEAHLEENDPALRIAKIYFILKSVAQINTLRKAVFAELEKLENKAFLINLFSIKESEFKAADFGCPIDTVDAFQGEEKDFIIIATLRSTVREDDFDTDFLQDPRRICVALTRAKIFFTIFGDSDLMGTATCWKEIVADPRNKKCIYEFNDSVLDAIFTKPIDL
uniref:AAA_12 domain-containing protein n=1 Tax=Parastrongyloides trichosuri TaxID=131310 RepID=A0A0N4ZTW8_PARTI